MVIYSVVRDLSYGHRYLSYDSYGQRHDFWRLAQTAPQRGWYHSRQARRAPRLLFRHALEDGGRRAPPLQPDSPATGRLFPRTRRRARGIRHFRTYGAERRRILFLLREPI